jgi:PTH1 family peptidyl-tRNA hydrolase
MKLIIGLGNPGTEYENTRHNVGFLFLDYFAQKNSFKLNKKFSSEMLEIAQNNEKFILEKPQTFMNRSGEAVSKIKNFYKITNENIYVVHDDLDLRLGEFKIQKGIGPKLHNGILSIEEFLKGKDFYRIRIGVDNRTDVKIPGQEYVLGKFTKEENQRLLQVFDGIAAGINPSQ